MFLRELERNNLRILRRTFVRWKEIISCNLQGWSMRTFYKILLIIIAIAYLISPVDLIPDFLIPYIGWIDDATVLWLIFYYLKFNKLPSFFYTHKNPSQNGQSDSSAFSDSSTFNNNNFFSNGYGDRRQDQNHRYGSTKEENRTYNQKHTSGSKENTSGSKDANYQNKQSKKSPYEILGIDKNATEQEIRAAYRKLVKQYHPDRVASLGKEFQELANKKFIEIKDAYNTIMGL